MFSKELEEVIDAAIADGVLTDKERAVLHKRGQAEGVDPDELDVVIDGRLAKIKKQEDWLRPTPPQNLGNQKMGNIIKCPSCGAQVTGGSAVCPECGYTFSNVAANSSAEKLQEKLDAFNRRQEEREDNRTIAGQITKVCSQGLGMDNTYKYKMDIISTFPVPNTRADLLEFLTMLQYRAKSTGPRNGQNMSREEDLSYAYWLLFTNCINKARLSFSNDKDFQPYFSFYEEEIKKTKGIFGFLKTSSPLVKIITTALGLGLLVLIFFILIISIAISCN